MHKHKPTPGLSPWRHKLHVIIFEADTPAGKDFDLMLLVAIAISVLAVMLESVNSIQVSWGTQLRYLEWALTFLFTIEYGLRLASVTRPHKYALSFFGLIDLLSLIPTYLMFFFGGVHTLTVIRVIRLLRVFRILKLARYISEAQHLIRALRASRARITVFIGAVITLSLIMGTIMYLVEGEENGFTSIPKSVYWAIVTMTTVGYGDIAPQTALGQSLASILMIMGYGIIAVPTGIITVAMANESKAISTQACPACSKEGHDTNAKYCKFCSSEL